MKEVVKITEPDATYVGKRVENYIRFMCKKCKFYKNRCIKGRLVEKCALKGLKNKE